MFVNRRYQRKLVWTLEEKQRLIESILKRYPIPAVLLAERADGNYEIIDGLQRLFAIMSFIETAFPTLDGRYFDVSQFPTAQLRSAEGAFSVSEDVEEVISSREVSALLDYTLAISVMRGSSEADIDDVFGRINTYGHRLSDQERRQAGVQDSFSDLVRELACSLRGDVSSDVLALGDMPQISIDLPKARHGYEVRAEEVIWVSHGILRSTDLRDSMDEQCVADIAACIVGADLIQRSKDALDAIYRAGDPENERIEIAVGLYGAEKLQEEITFCITEILKVASKGVEQKLRTIIFSKPTNNAYAATFATIVIAFHEVLIGGSKRIADYAGVKNALTRLDSRIETGRGSTSVSERRKNVDAVKGLLQGHVVESDLSEVYSNGTIVDLENILRRSAIELPHYELKQGLLDLHGARSLNNETVTKVLATICAMANNGPGRAGQILIGVADKPQDADRVAELDGVTPRIVGSRSVVGVSREATILGESREQYFTRWRDAIKNSDLSSPLKGSVLSALNFNDYYGLGVILISVPPQDEVAYFAGDLYVRSGDETLKVQDAKSIAGVVNRFSK